MKNHPFSLRAPLLLAALLLTCAAVPSALAAASAPASAFAADTAPGNESKPAARRDPAHEALVNRVIDAAGMREQMREMQKSVQQGFAASFQQRLGANPTPEARARLDKLSAAVGESFRGEDFVARIVAVLHEEYSAARLNAALAALNTPLIKRMTEVEKQHVEPAAMIAFAGQLRQQPLPPARAAVLARLDAASGASELNARVVMNVARLVLYANPALSAGQADAAAAEIQAHRGDILNRARAQTALQFAYTYREVGEADLAAYAAASEADSLHWFNEKMGVALGRQFDAGMAKMVGAFRNIMRPGGAAAAS